MVNYNCEKCGKKFNQKSNWLYHSQRKYPCEKKESLDNKINLEANFGANKIIYGSGSNEKMYTSNINKKYIINSNTKKNTDETNINNSGANNLLDTENKTIKSKIVNCRFCLKQFLYTKNLNKHIREERCEVLKLQKQQKENIFINLINEEKIVNQTKKELNNKNTKNNIMVKTNTNQMDFLIEQIKLLNEKLEQQQMEKETEKKQTEKKLKLMNERQIELEKNNEKLTKTNEKLQNKMNKIVNKNKINNTQNITNNTIINNNGVKLVNFGSEDLEKINYQVFIDTIKNQGAALCNKAIEGIHFNKDHPENQNIYISDFNRDKVMIYKNEKWIIDNW